MYLTPAPADFPLVDDGLGFWAAAVGALVQVGGAVLEKKAAAKVEKSARDHEMKMAKLQAEIEMKKASLLARAQPMGGGGTPGWIIPAGIGVAALGLVVFFMRNK